MERSLVLFNCLKGQESLGCIAARRPNEQGDTGELVKCSPASVRTIGEAATQQTQNLVGNPTCPHHNSVKGLQLEVLILAGIEVISVPKVINGFPGNRQDDLEEIQTCGPSLSEPSFKTDTFSTLLPEHLRRSSSKFGNDICHARLVDFLDEFTNLLHSLLLHSFTSVDACAIKRSE
jgi:hypothetical protein